MLLFLFDAFSIIHCFCIKQFWSQDQKYYFYNQFEKQNFTRMSVHDKWIEGGTQWLKGSSLFKLLKCLKTITMFPIVTLQEQKYFPQSTIFFCIIDGAVWSIYLRNFLKQIFIFICFTTELAHLVYPWYLKCQQSWWINSMVAGWYAAVQEIRPEPWLLLFQKCLCNS